jgi:hypothetical protein
MMTNTKEAWIVEVNSDLTEGRGQRVVKAVCEIEATAMRIAHKADVQGSYGKVRRVELKRVDRVPAGHEWWGPVTIVPATEADKAKQEQNKARRAVEKKAREAGLTEEDIAQLRQG